jgi:hypothetical protein
MDNSCRRDPSRGDMAPTASCNAESIGTIPRREVIARMKAELLSLGDQERLGPMRLL